jgi:signal transduction histidine kinase
VLVDAIEASAELHDPQAIARAVLQAIQPAIRFEWAVVLRLFHHEHFSTPPAAEMVATYPTGLAGADAGAAWTPIDRSEQAVLEAGEPSLDGQLTRDDEDRSPLRRPPAFGMRSRLFVPLFAPAGAGVNGGMALYSTQPMAFSPADGLRLERFVRRLGRFVGPAVEVASASEAAAPAAGEPAAPPETDEAREPDANGEMRRLADFAVGVAHELNNPLAAVLGYAQLLPQLSEEERGPALSAIEAETLRASEVTRDPLAFARQQPPATRDMGSMGS